MSDPVKPVPDGPNVPTAFEVSRQPSPAAAPTTDAAALKPYLSPATDPGEIGWLGNYRIFQVLGKGGMGMVLKAEDVHLRRVVALKVMLPDLMAHAVARDRFLREARAMAAVRSDHVVTIYQVGQENDLPYFAMEFLHGENLADRLEKNPRPRLSQILRMGKEIARGLADAHAEGLIHRDIKPGNIWVEDRREGSAESREPTESRERRAESREPCPPALDSRLSTLDSFRLKILDFGLAFVTREANQLTNPGTVLGTPYFMSPEQARGEHVDGRSDLFSLGAVLYYLCTGELPFEGHSPMAVLTALATKAPRPPREINPDMPQALSDLVLRLLEKDPAQRPATALEVIELLQIIEGKIQETWTSGLRALTPVNLPAAPTQPSAPTSWLPSRRRLLALGGIVALVAAIVTASLFWNHHSSGPAAPQGAPIVIGILHSRTGPMAISERPVIDALLLAVEDLNQQGGVLGRPVRAVVEDGESEETVFAARARKLIDESGACALFGCWTSASRKAVKDVVEDEDHLLFYSVQFEGLENSPNIIYLGPTPNQQIIPALQYAVGFLNRRQWFLVGSDYVFPRAAHEIIKDEAKQLGCTIAGEAFIPLEATNAVDAVQKIAASDASLILNTLNGDINVAFFRELRRAGIDSKKMPTLSFSISETELSPLHVREIAGDFSAGTYFQTIDRPQNHEFLKRFFTKYPTRSAVSDPMQSSYAAVHIWAQAVTKAGTEEVRTVRKQVRGQEFEAPQGLITIDPTNRHTKQQARIGQIMDTGKFKDIFVTPEPVAAEPFPPTRTRQQWDAFLGDLYKSWGGRWSNPGK